MNQLSEFLFQGNMKVRSVVLDGEPWFVAKDVADALEYADPSKMYMRLEEYEKGKIKSAELAGSTSTYGNNDITIINESGVYSAILGSNKPEAKAFKRWLTTEVLPALRKSGGYMVSVPDETPEQLLKRAVLVATEMVERQQRSINQGYKSVIGRKDSILSKAKDELDVNREKDIVPAISDLKTQIGESKAYATIKAMKRFFPSMTFKWSLLRDYSDSKELDIKQVSDPTYGKVNAYSREAWLNTYNIDLEELF